MQLFSRIKVVNVQEGKIDRFSLNQTKINVLCKMLKGKITAEFTECEKVIKAGYPGTLFPLGGK